MFVTANQQRFENPRILITTNQSDYTVDKNIRQHLFHNDDPDIQVYILDRRLSLCDSTDILDQDMVLHNWNHNIQSTDNLKKEIENCIQMT